MDSMFGPLSRDYCVYFYALAVITALLFAVSIGSFMYAIASGHKLTTFKMVQYIGAFLQLFIAYFVNRLLYTMCMRSI